MKNNSRRRSGYHCIAEELIYRTSGHQRVPCHMFTIGALWPEYLLTYVNGRGRDLLEDGLKEILWERLQPIMRPLDRWVYNRWVYRQMYLKDIPKKG